MPPRESPPQDHEFEVSLFGPGIGESVVAHLGNGKWIVVDSCLAAGGERPIAIEYLECLGVDISQNLELVVASHWHDDHIRGLAQLVKDAPKATFVCSAALLKKEFLTLVAASRNCRLIEHTSGLSEFRTILDHLTDEKGKKSGPDRYADEGKLLHRTEHPHSIEVWSLSPSAQTITDSNLFFAEFLPIEGEPIARVRTPSPNEVSVVILIKSAEVSILLGADLETGANERRGWRAIIRSNVCPESRSGIYKVAHHGSSNADFPEIWTAKLNRTPVAAVAPYNRGVKPLPSVEDVSRMKEAAHSLYCTAWPHERKQKFRGAVGTTLNQVVRKNRHRTVRGVPGHIRLRTPIYESTTIPNVELFNGARKL